jgi:LysR family transcriptional regulator, transcriptional activator of nhaA
MNYRHLFYFWIVAKEGGMSQASKRLNITVQTISSQVHLLEESLGFLLFKPAGRGLALTDAGKIAAEVADQIFSLGERLPDLLKQEILNPRFKIKIGISDVLPKLVTRDLLQSVISQKIHLVITESNFDTLLGELALHRLDLVLADQPATLSNNLTFYSELISSSEIAWFGSKKWLSIAQNKFPQILTDIPILLPTSQSKVRLNIDQWFYKNNIQPQIAGEFEDSALLKTFGQGGLGVLPAPECIKNDLKTNYGLFKIGKCDGVFEHFYAIRSERKIANPIIQSILKNSIR